MSKLITTVVFIVTVISFGRYDFGRLVPYVFYPAILLALSETPYMLFLKRVLIAIPFCLFIGVSNLLLEQDTAFVIGAVNVSFGALSFGVILFRVCLCVMAVLLLVAVTPFSDLAEQLRGLRIPNVFILMFEMTYRYMGVLFGEAASMHMAYTLRGAERRGVEIRHAGNFAGFLLIRSFARAERIYSAMMCRGYLLKKAKAEKKKIRMADAVYCAAVCLLCLLFRFVNVGLLIAGFAERGL